MVEKKLIMLIDDDSVCNAINTIFLKNKFGNHCELITFQKPVEALKYLSGKLKHKEFRKILILLDINMPVMTGWEFLEQYALLAKHETQVLMYVLSSSIYRGDADRINANPIVLEFITKPITNTIADELLIEMNK